MLGHLVVDPSFNAQCSDKCQGQLDKLRNWDKPSKQASWQHLDDCYGSDATTTGLAYVGTVCEGNWAVGVNWKSKGLFGQTWKTFAHELGHNFGGSHTFEEGQGRHVAPRAGAAAPLPALPHPLFVAAAAAATAAAACCSHPSYALS